MTYHSVVILLVLMSLGYSRAAQSQNEPEPARVNKLQYMYQLFYLPFSVKFREGRTVDDILPYITDKITGQPRLIKAEELQELDAVWNSIREPMKKKSLLISTPVPVGQSVRISHHLASHNIAVTRGPLDGLSINERIQLAELLKDKPAEIQVAFRQLRFLKSFLNLVDEGKFNFFIVSASWCDSCKEYRALFEAYVKNFGINELNLHSIVINDPLKIFFRIPNATRTIVFRDLYL
jgi:thiol-disulfide isomerase/thioredoxin